MKDSDKDFILVRQAWLDLNDLANLSRYLEINAMAKSKILHVIGLLSMTLNYNKDEASRKHEEEKQS